MVIDALSMAGEQGGGFDLQSPRVAPSSWHRHLQHRADQQHRRQHLAPAPGREPIAVVDPEGAVQTPQAQEHCRRRSKSDPPRRSNIDPGMDADRVMVGCGQV